MTVTRTSPFSKSQKPAAVTAATEVTAKNRLDSLDKCPCCNSSMLPVSAAGVPAYYCNTHRVALPQQV